MFWTTFLNLDKKRCSNNASKQVYCTVFALHAGTSTEAGTGTEIVRLLCVLLMIGQVL
eukprot:COSAG01_NODE_4512_length_4964_cov_2.390545_3_plen_58_part_00